MTMNDFTDNTYWMLLQVAIRSKHNFMHLSEQYDLGGMQLITLCSLIPGQSIAMNNISEFLVCDASNVTGIVDRLVRRGLIVRQESSEDRRVKVIQLTSDGERLRGEVLAKIADSRPESLASLSDDEADQLNRLLKKALLTK